MFPLGRGNRFPSQVGSSPCTWGRGKAQRITGRCQGCGECQASTSSQGCKLHPSRSQRGCPLLLKSGHGKTVWLWPRVIPPQRWVLIKCLAENCICALQSCFANVTKAGYEMRPLTFFLPSSESFLHLTQASRMDPFLLPPSSLTSYLLPSLLIPVPC